MQKDPSRRRHALCDRLIEVIDDTLTGEVLLDEALKMMKSSEKMSVSSWIDLMSGTSPPSPPQNNSECCNSLLTISYQARHGTL